MGYPAGNRPAASPSDGTGAGSAVPLPAGGADLAGDGGLQPKGGRGSPFLVPGGEGAAHGGGHGLRPSGRAAQHRGTHPGGGPLRHLSPHGRIFPGRLPPPGGGIGHGHGEKRGLRGRRPGGAGSRSCRFRSHRRRYNRSLLPRRCHVGAYLPDDRPQRHRRGRILLLLEFLLPAAASIGLAVAAARSGPCRFFISLCLKSCVLFWSISDSRACLPCGCPD